MQPEHLYIHIPFCKQKCAYCDFVRFTKCESLIPDYINKIALEIKAKVKSKLKSIYIGGGTPNYLDDLQLSKLLSSLQKYRNNQTEFTIECNPEFINAQQVKLFKKFNVNRVSIGAQCINNTILKKYGRKHTITDIERAITLLQTNGICNISLDFIYGFNELRDIDIKKNIDFVVKNKVKHVSFYALEIKPGSLLKTKNYMINENKIDKQLCLIIKTLAAHNYIRYEVSN
jgi:oxygen-independent coproporphyrinogen-3 oxidase